METSYNRRNHAPASPAAPWQTALMHGLEVWERPLWSALLALAVYWVLAAHHGPVFQLTRYPYFNYLADALLHGQLHLRETPAFTRDLSMYSGRLYLYWSPLPAVLLMPFIAIFGTQLSDILITMVVGSLNVALVALLLRRANEHGIVALEPVQRGLLVLFFAFGTVHLTLPPYGRVWFVGQLVGFACVACAYLAVLSLRRTPAFFLAGVAVAGALLTRNHLALAGLWPAWFLVYQHRGASWRRLVGYVAAGIAPVVVAVCLLGLYNWLRFGSALDNGLAYHRMADVFARDFQRYGAFNLHYLPTNIKYQLLVYPFPLSPKSAMGGSLFLLSPVFFAAIWALFRDRTRWSNWMLAATVALVAIPILLLMGTGWVQWGPRYTLDYTVPLLLLTAVGLRRWPVWLVAALTGLSIGHYLVGTLFLSQFM